MVPLQTEGGEFLSWKNQTSVVNPPPSINLLEVATPMEFRPGLNKNLCLGVAEKSRKAGPFMPRNLRIYRCDKIKDKFKRWVIKN